MNLRGPSGEKAVKRPPPTKVQTPAQAKRSCSFCWFVLSLYPTLKGMTPRDTVTYREHLKNMHGLKEEITA